MSQEKPPPVVSSLLNREVVRNLSCGLNFGKIIGFQSGGKAPRGTIWYAEIEWNTGEKEILGMTEARALLVRKRSDHRKNDILTHKSSLSKKLNLEETTVEKSSEIIVTKKEKLNSLEISKVSGQGPGRPKAKSKKEANHEESSNEDKFLSLSTPNAKKRPQQIVEITKKIRSKKDDNLYDIDDILEKYDASQSAKNEFDSLKEEISTKDTDRVFQKQSGLLSTDNIVECDSSQTELLELVSNKKFINTEDNKSNNVDNFNRNPLDIPCESNHVFLTNENLNQQAQEDCSYSHIPLGIDGLIQGLTLDSVEQVSSSQLNLNSDFLNLRASTPDAERFIETLREDMMNFFLTIPPDLGSLTPLRRPPQLTFEIEKTLKDPHRLAKPYKYYSSKCSWETFLRAVIYAEPWLLRNNDQIIPGIPEKRVQIHQRAQLVQDFRTASLSDGVRYNIIESMILPDGQAHEGVICLEPGRSSQVFPAESLVLVADVRRGRNSWICLMRGNRGPIAPPISGFLPHGSQIHDEKYSARLRRPMLGPEALKAWNGYCQEMEFTKKNTDLIKKSSDMEKNSLQHEGLQDISSVKVSERFLATDIVSDIKKELKEVGYFESEIDGQPNKLNQKLQQWIKLEPLSEIIIAPGTDWQIINNDATRQLILGIVVLDRGNDNIIFRN